ncbi:MAG TPA: alpha/beta hydrolase [Candidatus Limnocylindria bacterium]
MALDPRVLAAPTVLAPPAGARVERDLVYRTDGDRVLKLDLYRPASSRGASPVVFLVNGDAPEEIIAAAKDWGVFRSYGEHLAARGIVGVPFNHRSGNRLAPTEVAADVQAAIGFVRRRGEDFGIDVNRVGVWVFSAGGPFGLAPLLQRRPEWLRCAAGFYTIWDLAPLRASLPWATDETVRRWSCVGALDAENPDLPPLFLARAGRDHAALLEGTDTFVRKAQQLGVNLTVLDHPTGQHGFDTRDDDERSREIIRETLEFFVRHLGPPMAPTES